jgi:hypothetical protein
MGLDMYLTRKTYVKQWSHQTPEEQFEITITKGGKPYDGIDLSNITNIEEEVGYWRKANQIHRWFVENVQNGIDDCGEYSVSKSELEELRNICTEVFNDHSKAEELLPSASGFFFGNTDYDEWYYNDVQHTIEIIDKIFSESDGNQDIYYSSSW